MAMIVAAGGSATAQRSLHIRACQILRRVACRSGVDSDVVLGKQIQCAPTHAPGNDRLDALLVQPARQQTRLMRRRDNEGLGQNLFGLRIGLD